MKIEVLDTTLRDGEQTPGISLNAAKKLRIAVKLDEIGVNAIEAGSAVTSEGERDAIRLITSQGLNAEIVSFARTLIKDVDYCLECDVDAVNVVVPTSDLHLKYKLRKSRDEMIEDAVKVVECGIIPGSVFGFRHKLGKDGYAGIDILPGRVNQVDVV